MAARWWIIASNPKEFMFMEPRDVSSRPFMAALFMLMTGGLLLSPVSLAASTIGDDSALPVLTLSDCVRMALQNSAGLRISEQEVDVASRNVTEAWGSFLPNLSASGSYGKSERTDFDAQYSLYETRQRLFETAWGDSVYIPYEAWAGTAFRDVTVKATSKNWGVNANLNLFDGLANINRLKAAQARREAASYSSRYMREMVIQNVAVAYYELLRYHRLKEVAAEAKEHAEAELSRTETYFHLGSAAKSDVLQQRVRLGQTNYDLVVADNRVKKAMADLAYAMNQPPTGQLAVDTSALATTLTLDENVDHLYAMALENRLDLLGVEQEIFAAERMAAAANGAFIPRLDVYMRYTRSYDESPYRFGSQESQAWIRGAQVSWDVFNRFQNFTNRSKARAQARIAEYRYDQAQLDAQLEIQQYYNAMSEAVQKHLVSVETITHAQEELRLARERFRVGAGTQLERITAEVNLARARADEVQAICDYLISRIRLWRATGRLGNEEYGLP
jgi:outer membrane protein